MEPSCVRVLIDRKNLSSKIKTILMVNDSQEEKINQLADLLMNEIATLNCAPDQKNSRFIQD